VSMSRPRGFKPDLASEVQNSASKGLYNGARLMVVIWFIQLGFFSEKFIQLGFHTEKFVQIGGRRSVPAANVEFIQLETLAVTWAESTSSRPTASEPLRPLTASRPYVGFGAQSGSTRWPVAPLVLQGPA